MLEIGSVFDRKYTILREIGHGGMSTVYLALNERVNKTWAIKEVRKNGLTDNVTSTQSLMAEVEMLKQLDHPNIVNIVDVVENEDSFIIVMDYIQGQDLLSVVRAKGPLDEDAVILWMKQLCDVMWYLHSQKPPIIYRDMKPANVMLKPDGDVVVIDFGTARTNKGGNDQDTTWLGTRGYAAPEQFGGQGETDARTDIYTLGTTMYHLLTGYSPADTNFYIYPIGELRPELKGSGVEKIVAKCCEPKREDRYQSAAELMNDLEHVHDLDIEVQKKDRKRLRLFAIPVLACLVGAAASVGFSFARSSTIQTTFETSLKRAQTAESFQDGFNDFKSALTMQPDNPEAYAAILDKIVNERDREFTVNDRKILQELKLIKPTVNTGKTCYEIFEDTHKADYDRFRYNVGLMYFRYYGSGSYKNAAAELEGLNTSEYLEDWEKNLAASFSLISNVVEANSSTGGNSKQFGVEKKGWYDVYSEFYNLVGDPDTAGSKCGGAGAAFATYRTMASLIQTKIKNFKDQGLTAERLTQLLDAGETFVKRTQGGDSDQAVRAEAEDAIKDARRSVNSAYNQKTENS